MVGSGGYHFDGSYRVVLGDVLPAAGPYTITVWVDPDPGLPFGSAISEPLDTTTVNNDVSLTINSLSVGFEGTQNDTPTGVDVAIDIRGAWHHIALVFDGFDRQFYLDGSLGRTGMGPWLTGSAPLAIGADLDAGSFAVPYTGDMDNLRIYRRALSQAEISAVFALR